MVKKRNPLIPFKSSSKKKKSADGEIVMNGDLGKLKFSVYKRGTVHVTDGTLTFKKNIDQFDDEIEKVESMKVSEWEKKKIHRLNGAGDTDNLIFEFNELTDDIDVYLKKREHRTIEKLKNILSKARVKVSR